MRKILVTSALPYANNDLHLGHLLEHIQTDIWTRAMKLQGHQCIAVCGADAHGTPIMLKAQQLGIAPETMVEDIKKSQERDFTSFHIDYDSYHTTHSMENKALASTIYQSLKANGDIEKRTITQLYDPEKNMFLPDRFVKGTCPNCKAEEQYGDNCEQCGATYAPTELINPTSVLSGATPIEKPSEHFFFDLPKHEALLKAWTQGDHLQPQVRNKLSEWFEAGLRQWDISRDAPYFGFQIPGEENKYFYVWLDAPIGYMASFKKLTDQDSSLSFEDFWHKDSKAELYHFIGKDIIYFHALFWPAMLHSAGFRTPTGIFAHGFLTVNGQKMSKSRGTFIKAATYAKHLNTEYLRYYFATKLNAQIEDLDLNLQDFTNKINADLVGKFVNIASRCAGFINKRFDAILSDTLDNIDLVHQLIHAGEEIAQLYESREYSKAMKLIMSLADLANQYIDSKKPWIMIKEEDKQVETHQVCSTGINLFRLLALYLKPVLPSLATHAETFLNVPPLTWQDKNQPLLSHQINRFKPLMNRIETTQVDALIDASKEEVKQLTSTTNENTEIEFTPLEDEIEIDEFFKVDLRIAKILSAEHVDGSNKLLKLKVDIGFAQKQIFAGIKKAYQPEELIGKLTVVVANLKPRKMRFGLSEGMMTLASGPSSEELWLIGPESGAQPGMRIS